MPCKGCQPVLSCLKLIFWNWSVAVAGDLLTIIFLNLYLSKKCLLDLLGSWYGRLSTVDLIFGYIGLLVETMTVSSFSVVSRCSVGLETSLLPFPNSLEKAITFYRLLYKSEKQATINENNQPYLITSNKYINFQRVA